MSDRDRYIKALDRINEEIAPYSNCTTCPVGWCGSERTKECKLDYEALTTAAEAICRLLSLLD